jgi:P27 family predicted phage terminase small subunit
MVVKVMARKAKPIELHLLDGNKNRKTKKEIEHRKAAEAALKPGSDKVTPPDWLCDAGVSVFTVLAAELLKINLVSNIDIYAMARWAHCYAKYQECAAKVNKEGVETIKPNSAGFPVSGPHPLLSTMKQLNEQMTKIESEFGLSPASRAKLAMPPKEEKELTEFEKTFGNL